MAKQRTIAELADRERELTEELSELRAEIASRAGEVDQPKPPPEKQSVQTATDKQAESVQTTTATS